MDNYGTFVENYEAYTEKPGGMEHELGRKPALKALGNILGGTVLNFGCGPAINSKELQTMGAKVIGIDVSEEELKAARERDPHSTYFYYDGIHLSETLEHRKMNGILASFCVCAITDEAMKPILRDMRQLLAEGGKLVIVEPNLEKALGTRYHDLHYHAQDSVKSGDHIHVTLGVGKDAVELYHDIYRLHADYRRLLEEAGFTVTAIQQPRPRGWKLLKWWRALLIPPFVVIVAQ